MIPAARYLDMECGQEGGAHSEQGVYCRICFSVMSLNVVGPDHYECVGPHRGAW